MWEWRNELRLSGVHGRGLDEETLGKKGSVRGQEEMTRQTERRQKFEGETITRARRVRKESRGR